MANNKSKDWKDLNGEEKKKELLEDFKAANADQKETMRKAECECECHKGAYAAARGLIYAYASENSCEHCQPPKEKTPPASKVEKKTREANAVEFVCLAKEMSKLTADGGYEISDTVAGHLALEIMDKCKLSHQQGWEKGIREAIAHLQTWDKDYCLTKLQQLLTKPE